MQNKRTKYTVAVSLSLLVLGFTVGSLWLALPTRDKTQGPTSSSVLGATAQRASELAVSATLGKRYDVSAATHTYRQSIEVIIENTGQAEALLVPGSQLMLVDNKGEEYALTARYLDSQTVLGGPLRGGETATFTADFDIPEGRSAKRFIFQQDAATQQQVVRL